jgi:hypothetical protein
VNNLGKKMKKTILIVILSAMSVNLSASNYKVKMDTRQFNQNIKVEEYTAPPPPAATESPYTEKQTLNLDWKTENDGQIVLDTSSGLEWLTLNNTDGKSISQVQALLGSTYEGFRLPTQSEVVGFMQTNFPTRSFTMSTSTPLATGSDAIVFGGKIGYTYNTERIFGLFRNNRTTGNIVSYSGARVGYYIYNNVDFSSSLSANNGTYGVYLVSDGGYTYSSLQNPAINIPVN